MGDDTVTTVVVVSIVGLTVCDIEVIYEAVLDAIPVTVCTFVKLTAVDIGVTAASSGSKFTTNG